MCDGATALNTQISGGITTAIGAYYTARGEQENFKASANIADTNARLADLTAEAAIFAGQREEQMSRLATRDLKERQRTAYAGNGIALDSETAQRVLTSTDVMGEIEANTINANAARAAWGYRTEAVQWRNEALTKRASAKAISPRTRAMTSLINSASDVSASWYKLGKEGALEGTIYGKIYDRVNNRGGR
ncbi:MAG: hypothetical protein IT558_00765 [Alphaproteobacteria bacterium]|nr:hypothetical protein [Alphaproteobacteria bacterium]